jgi:uncharacterized protein (TIGR02265 family)
VARRIIAERKTSVVEKPTKTRSAGRTGVAGIRVVRLCIGVPVMIPSLPIRKGPMPQDRRDLESRLRRARPTDCVKGSLFNGICAAIDKALPGNPGAAELAKKYRKPFYLELSDYPVAGYLNLVIDAAELLETRLGGPVLALRAVGAAGGRSFLDSLVGRLAVRTVARKTPIEVLSYAPSVYAPSANYGKRWFTRVSEREGIFHTRGDFLPPGYHEGVLPEGCGVNGHRVQVETKIIDLLDADYRVVWDGQPPRASN